jgi:hypothetical protein
VRSLEIEPRQKVEKGDGPHRGLAGVRDTHKPVPRVLNPSTRRTVPFLHLSPRALGWKGYGASCRAHCELEG